MMVMWKSLRPDVFAMVLNHLAKRRVGAVERGEGQVRGDATEKSERKSPVATKEEG